MLSSNTKLDKDQKTDRKELMAKLPDFSQFGYSGRITTLVVPSGAVDMLYTAIASPDEQKLRRKVGEYVCLNRRYDGMGVPVQSGSDAQMIAEQLDW